MFIDLNHEIRSFAPIDIEKFSQNSEISEKVLDSIKSYNKAIEYLRTGSEDIAMIELKKVVSSNPDFYEAVNLLGLCYAYTNQMDKAEALFDKVVQGENNAIKAADYLNFISINGNKSTKKSSNTKNKTPENKPPKVVKETVKKSNLSEENIQSEYVLLKKLGTLLKKTSSVVIFNIFSVICLVVAIVFFFVATRDKIEDVDISSGPAINTQQTKDYDKVVAENKALKGQLETANSQLRELQLSAELSQVSVLYGQNKFIEAADKLMALPVAELSADLKTKYDAIKDNVLLKAANQLTIDGNTLYGNKKYSEAIQKLEKVFVLGNNWTFGDKALYILAKSYVEVNEIQKGTETYQKLIDNYPKSGYIKYAKGRLKVLK